LDQVFLPIGANNSVCHLIDVHRNTNVISVKPKPDEDWLDERKVHALLMVKTNGTSLTST